MNTTAATTTASSTTSKSYTTTTTIMLRLIPLELLLLLLILLASTSDINISTSYKVRLSTLSPRSMHALTLIGCWRSQEQQLLLYSRYYAVNITINTTQFLELYVLEL